MRQIKLCMTYLRTLAHLETLFELERGGPPRWSPGLDVSLYPHNMLYFQ